MERPELPSTKSPWFRYPEDLDPVLRDIRDNLDVLDSDVDDIQSGDLPIALAGIAGALGEYTGPWRGPHDSREWGIEADGNDHASDFATMSAELASESNRAVQFGAGVIPIGSTIQINASGVRLLGAGGARQASQGGTRFLFSGSGPLIQIGTDNGHDYDANEYNGPQYTVIDNINLQCDVSSGGTTLLNGMGKYKSGTYAIRDWRGGDIHVRDVLAENFDYSFWGVQSDLNTFYNFQQRYSHRGIYLGPRSDQCNIISYYGFFNDTALDLDGCQHVAVFGGAFVGDGSPSSPPVKIRSEWTRSCRNVAFYSPWFERYQGDPDTVDAFVEIGVGSTYAANDISFHHPTILTTAAATDYHVKSFAKLGNADAITIDGPSGTSVNLLDQLVEFVGATSPRVRIIATDISGLSTEYAVLNSGSGTPRWVSDLWNGDGIRRTGGGNAQNIHLADGLFGINTVPTSMLHAGGSFATPTNGITATTTLNQTHHTILADASAGAITVNLPTAAGITGRQYVIKKTDNVNNVVVDPASGEYIESAAMKTLTSQYAFLTIVSSGANWHIVGQGGTIT